MTGPTTSYETLTLDEPRPGVVVITLNRPERRNAMTTTMFGELEHAAEALEDDHRVVILTGAGTAFCAGYDLADADELAGLGALGMLDQQEHAARAVLAIRSMRVPVIAAVTAAAAGGGMPPTSGSRRTRPPSTCRRRSSSRSRQPARLRQWRPG